MPINTIEDVRNAKEAIEITQNIEKSEADVSENTPMPSPEEHEKVNAFRQKHKEFDTDTTRKSDDMQKQLEKLLLANQTLLAEVNNQATADLLAEQSDAKEDKNQNAVQVAVSPAKPAPGAKKDKPDDDVLAFYKKQFEKDGKYESPHQAPTVNDKGHTVLTFKDDKEAGQFFKDMAANKNEKGECKAFKVSDEKGNLLAYANGKDGKLYGPDRKELDPKNFGKIDEKNPVKAEGFDVNGPKAAAPLGQSADGTKPSDPKQLVQGIADAAALNPSPSANVPNASASPEQTNDDTAPHPPAPGRRD